MEFNIKWSAEDDGFVATCSEYPSLSWIHENPVEALRWLLRCIEVNIDDLEEQK